MAGYQDSLGYQIAAALRQRGGLNSPSTQPQVRQYHGYSLPSVPSVTLQPKIKPRRTHIKKTAHKLSVQLSTLSAQNKPIPVVYGECMLGARVFAVGKDSSGSLVIGCIVGWGEIDGYIAHYVNDKPLPSGITVTTYTGTTTQGIDPTLQSAISGYDDNLVRTVNGETRGIAYVVYKIPPGTIKGFPRFVVHVRGLKTIYDPRTATTGYSDNPALCFRDWLESKVYGPGWHIDDDSVGDAADACDELVSGEKRRIVNIAIQTAKDVNSWIETWRAYAGLLPLWFDDGRYFCKPDRPTSVTANLSHDDGAFLEGSFQIEKDTLKDKPTVVRIHYTDTRSIPWRTAVAEASLPGVNDGTTERIVSDVPMPGITRYSQAHREAIERLNEANLCDLFVNCVTFDEGLKILPGDVVNVTHPLGLTDKPMRVLPTQTNQPGRWALRLQEYDPAMYSSAVETIPTFPDFQMDAGIEIDYDQIIGTKPDKYAGLTDNNLIKDPEFKEAAYNESDFWQFDHVAFPQNSAFYKTGGENNTPRARIMAGGEHRNCVTTATFPAKYGDKFQVWGTYAKSSDFDGTVRVILYAYDAAGNVLGYPTTANFSGPNNTWLNYNKTIEITYEETAYVKFAAHVNDDATQGHVNWSSFYAGRTDGRAIDGLTKTGRLKSGFRSDELTESISLSDGFYVDSTGLKGVKSGNITFEIDIFGNAKFSGVLEGAEIRTSGGLKVLEGADIQLYSASGNPAELKFYYGDTPTGWMQATGLGVALFPADTSSDDLLLGDSSVPWHNIQLYGQGTITLMGDTGTGIEAALTLSSIAEIFSGGTLSLWANAAGIFAEKIMAFNEVAAFYSHQYLFGLAADPGIPSDGGVFYTRRSGNDYVLRVRFPNGVIRDLAYS